MVSTVGWLVACASPSESVTPEDPTPALALEVSSEPPAPPPAPPPKVPADAMAVGTFNLQWAFDSLDADRRSKVAREAAARTEDDWAWKRDRIAEILAHEKLDIVALQELGGERELQDLVSSVAVKGGHPYEIAWQPSTDRFTGQQVAILSRFPIREVRRYELSISKHIAADIELPHGEILTVIAVHLRAGSYASHEAERAKQARSLKRRTSLIQKQHPVLVLGTVNSPSLPSEYEYRTHAPGILAGAHTRGVEHDDCMDSGDEGFAQRTTVDGEALDRIFSCGLRIRRAETSAIEEIRRDAQDPDDRAWSDVPVEDAPYRDVSDHFVVWAEVELPARVSASRLADPWAEVHQGGNPVSTSRSAF